MKSMTDQFAKSEHAFDINAEPEPIDCGTTDVNEAVGIDGDVIDDGFGPVGDDDYSDDGDRGLLLTCF